jgi:hypothetical protein
MLLNHYLSRKLKLIGIGKFNHLINTLSDLITLSKFNHLIPITCEVRRPINM